MTDFKVGDKVQIDPALVNSGARVASLGVVGTVEQVMSSGMIDVAWQTRNSWHHAWELVRATELPKKLRYRGRH